MPLTKKNNNDASSCPLFRSNPFCSSFFFFKYVYYIYIYLRRGTVGTHWASAGYKGDEGGRWLHFHFHENWTNLTLLVGNFGTNMTIPMVFLNYKGMNHAVLELPSRP